MHDSALRVPDGALAGAVRAFYWHDLPALEGLPLGQRMTYVPPSPYAGLVWLIEGRAMLVSCGGQSVEQELPPVFVAGPHRHAYRSLAITRYRSFGIAFRPGVLALLMGGAALPVDEIVDARTALPADWQAWLNEVACAPNHERRLGLCEAFLAPRWAQHSGTSWPTMMEDWGRPARQLLLTALNWTQRHFQRRTRALVGLTPGEVDRLLRLEQALLDVRDGGASIAEAACEHGFADQPHLTREARTWFERSPHHLRRQLEGEETEGDWLLRL